MAQLVVEANDLTKNYGDFTAVKQLNLRIEEGEMFGFLGANGAGKTTTLLM
ncbi:MAG: ATP-binding cassette domain-containing protein, partial [Dehalococcoidia bacterium]|nr:ATP-binding cassette domain-containing protein [Dehalococcoidia bacterium]